MLLMLMLLLLLLVPPRWLLLLLMRLPLLLLGLLMGLPLLGMLLLGLQLGLLLVLLLGLLLQLGLLLGLLLEPLLLLLLLGLLLGLLLLLLEPLLLQVLVIEVHYEWVIIRGLLFLPTSPPLLPSLPRPRRWVEQSIHEALDLLCCWCHWRWRRCTLCWWSSFRRWWHHDSVSLRVGLPWRPACPCISPTNIGLWLRTCLAVIFTKCLGAILTYDMSHDPMRAHTSTFSCFAINGRQPGRSQPWHLYQTASLGSLPSWRVLIFSLGGVSWKLCKVSSFGVGSSPFAFITKMRRNRFGPVSSATL